MKREKNKKHIYTENDNEMRIIDDKTLDDKKIMKANGYLDKPVVNFFVFPVESMRKRYKIRYKHNKKHLVFDAVLFSIILFLLGVIGVFLFIVGPLLADKTDVSLDFGDGKIHSGQEFTFYVRYNNPGEEALRNVKLGLALPVGVQVRNQDENYDSLDRVFDLGDLEAGGSGVLAVKAFVLGDVPSQNTVGAILSYDKKIFQTTDRRMKKFISKDFTLSGSALTVSMDTPDQVISNQEFEFKVNVKNTSNDILRDVSVVFLNDFNSEFLLQETNDYSIQDNKLAIGEIQANGELEFNFTTTIPNEQSGADVFGKSIHARGFMLFQNKEYKQTETVKMIIAQKPKFEINVALEKKKSLDPGAKAEYIVSYENTESQDINDLSLSIELPQDVFDIASLVTNGEYADGKITWHFDKIPMLRLVHPKQSGILRFALKVRPDIDYNVIKTSKNNFYVVLKGDARYTLADSGQKVLLPIAELQNKINSQLILQGYARYYTSEGEQLGRGPLPPTVGEETTYWIFLKVDNTTNRVRNVKVKGVLPPNVKYENRFSVIKGNDLVYNENDRTVTWSIEQIDEYTGEVNPSVGVSFEVSLIPTGDQLGNFASLLQDISVIGFDTFTNETIIYNALSVTTDLTQDYKASQIGGKIVE